MIIDNLEFDLALRYIMRARLGLVSLLIVGCSDAGGVWGLFNGVYVVLKNKILFMNLCHYLSIHVRTPSIDINFMIREATNAFKLSPTYVGLQHWSNPDREIGR